MTDNFVTHAQLQAVERHMEARMDRTDRRVDAVHDDVKEVKQDIKDMPASIVDTVDKKRRLDRRQFIRDTTALLTGVGTAVAAVIAFIALVVK